MAMEDKNKHRPKKLRERNPTASLECSERQRMAMQDKNKHRPRKMRQKSQICETTLYRQLFALKKLIARWGNILKRQAKLVDKERQRVLRQRKAWKKKDQEERRRVEVLKQKRQREEERSRRERLRKRMRADLTMDDILGQKGCRMSGLGQDGRSSLLMYYCIIGKGLFLKAPEMTLMFVSLYCGMFSDSWFMHAKFVRVVFKLA